MVTIAQKITTNNKRKWACISTYFTEALVDKWTTAGFDYTTAREWLGCVAITALELEIQNPDYFRFLRDQVDLRINKATGARLPVTAKYYVDRADWKKLKEEYKVFVEDQNLVTPKITPEAGTGRYTGAVNKPSPRLELLTKPNPTLIYAPDPARNPVKQLIPWDFNIPEAHTLAEWVTLHVLSTAKKTKIDDYLKTHTEHIKGIVGGGTAVATMAMGVDTGLNKRYSVPEAMRLLKNADYEITKATWATAEKAKGITFPQNNYDYLTNPTHALHKIENQKWKLWDVSLRNN